MRNPLLALALVVLAVSARADALSELRRLAGQTDTDAAKIATPAPVMVAQKAAEKAATEPKVIRVTDVQWNEAFPIGKDVVKAAGMKVGTKEFEKWSCEYTEGAATARCDFAYNVWPEICWYGYDHVVADIAIKAVADPKTAVVVVLKEWRSN